MRIKFNNLESLQRVSSFVILFNAFVIGIETAIKYNSSFKFYFDIIDALFVLFFTYEISIRLFFSSPLKTLFRDLKVFFQFFRKENKKIAETIDSLETWFWITFDLILVVASWIAFAEHFIKHPEIILILRMLRVFRIFRLFSGLNYIKRIERKIAAVIPTIAIFLILIFLLVYTYAILGMNLYGFQKFDSINYSTLYEAMMGMFQIMTNGWADVHKELRLYTSVHEIVTDFYLVSFFIFSVMITLNVFLAVMTTSIQEKLSSQKVNENKEVEKKMDDLQLQIEQLLNTLNKDKISK
jgi:hypothetical protein